MTNTRNYRTPGYDDDADVPLWNDRLAQDVANDVDQMEDAVAAVVALNPVPGMAVADPEYAIPLADQDGYAAGGITKDGAAQFVRLLHQPASVPAAALGPDVGITDDSDFEYAVPFIDADGYVAGGLLRNGSFNFPGITGGGEAADPLALAAAAATYTRSDRYRLACAGDSLTDGYDASGYWPDADAWPAKLAALLPSFVTVFNRGESGQTVDEISIRMGALKLACTVAGGEIPASGTVNVTIPAGVGWRPDRTWTFTGSLAGVPGTLTRTGTATTALTFTRTTAGTAVPAAAPVTFNSDQDVHAGDTMIIFAGRNDLSYSVTGSHATVPEHVVASTVRLVEYLTPQVKQVLLVGTITHTGETSGSAGHTAVTSINNQLAALYPGRFFDLRHYLVTKAIYDLGITPDATDLTKMNGDTLPPSIMAAGDSVHYSKATATLVAAQMYKQLTSRRWI